MYEAKKELEEKLDAEEKEKERIREAKFDEQGYRSSAPLSDDEDDK